MKKLAILSPLVILMASTSLAQDSCIVRPSCADMGYTKTESECSGKEAIKCPFDLTALFCPEGGNTIPDSGLPNCDDIEEVNCIYCKTFDSNCSVCTACCSTDTYPYTSSNCTLGKVPGGSTCTDMNNITHYSMCLCSDQYIYTSSNCSGILTGGTCTDNTGTYYAGCTINIIQPIDPCDYYTDYSCQYGCESYYYDCPSKCENCYANNCHNRTNESCDYGCASRYSDCPSKCQTCKECTPNNCDSFPYTSTPANAFSYSTCTKGCGDTNTYYKITKCNYSYELVDGVCVACDFGDYKLTSCPPNTQTCFSKTCGETKQFQIGICNRGYYIADSLDACLECDWGDYILDGDAECPENAYCSNTACGGMYKKKIYMCKDGYSISSDGTRCE